MTSTPSRASNILRSNDVFASTMSFSTASSSESGAMATDIFYNGSTASEDYQQTHVKYNQSSDQSDMSYINVTNELPINYAIPMYGQTMPFLLIITIIANTLIVVVLSKRHMRTPTNVVLIAMALCDMFTLLFPAPWLIYMYTLGNHYKPLYPISLCYIWFVMHEVSHLN